ncbi:hypothetical protein WJX73_006770 [Symbiochloris irregularis]|uniref:Exonuclease 1 n=1 Tax=Symbiochloris irregularis TaxID=706552 RepID=A0AAW1PK90_9CHLO
MGIQGLLPVLKSITDKVHIGKYAGKRVAVDAYCWLHKGAYCCSKELCENRSPDKCITFCMQRMELLRRHGVVPVLVFDGGRLPSKGDEEDSRARHRKENLDRARAHELAGNTAAAYESYQKAVDISPEVAAHFVQALKAAGVELIVAPYEADAQMARLALSGSVDAVLTEDSDLLPYGCPVVLFKMDKAGNCEEICLKNMALNRDLSLVGFTPQMFLEMCILAGCDFLKAIPGIGIRKAHAQMQKLKSFDRVCKSLRFSGHSVPKGYEQAFQHALWVFHHQTVYCPKAQACEPLRPLPPGGLLATAQVPMQAALGQAEVPANAAAFLGAVLPPEMARNIAEGNLNPHTLEPFSKTPQNVLQPLALNGSAAAGSLVGAKVQGTASRRGGLKKLLPVQANGIASYFGNTARCSSGSALRQFAAPRRTASGSMPEVDDSAAMPVDTRSRDHAGSASTSAAAQLPAPPRPALRADNSRPGHASAPSTSGYHAQADTATVQGPQLCRFQVTASSCSSSDSAHRHF